MTEVKRNKQILRYLLIAVSLIVGSITTLAQSLKGKVVDSRTQEPIIGAHVSIKGDKNTTAGTTTDIDGKFNINVKHYPTAIVVSYTGYNNEEIDVYEVTNDEIEISLNDSPVCILIDAAVTIRHFSNRMTVSRSRIQRKPDVLSKGSAFLLRDDRYDME